jgi:hypothetical protein
MKKITKKFKEPRSFEEQLLESCPALAKWQGSYLEQDVPPDPNAMGGGAPPAGGDDGGDMGSPDLDTAGGEGEGGGDPDISDIAHQVGELKKILDGGDLDGAKKAVGDLYSQLQSYDSGAPGDDGGDGGDAPPGGGDQGGDGMGGPGPGMGGSPAGPPMGPNEAIRYLRKILSESRKYRR